jgi:hypothetical protein
MSIVYSASNESAFSRELTIELREAGARVLAIVGGDKQTGGWPDRFICHPIFMGFIELKRERNGLDRRQQLEIEMLNRYHPCSAFVAMLREPAATAYTRFGKLELFELYWPNRHGRWLKYDASRINSVRALLQRLGEFQHEERNALVSVEG